MYVAFQETVRHYGVVAGRGRAGVVPGTGSKTANRAIRRCTAAAVDNTVPSSLRLTE